MPTFRVERNKGYTVMSNHHLRNKDLSLKAKGLLSQMLSLPEDWDYTMKGLALINKESIDAIRASLGELERHGYIERHRKRNEKGQLTGTEYIIYEQPVSEKPTLEEPILENPTLDNPTLDNPILENPTQINKDITSIEEVNTDPNKYPSINQMDSDGLLKRYAENGEMIKRNIDYDLLVKNYDREIIDEIVALMAEVLTIDAEYYIIEQKKYPTALIRDRLRGINYEKLESFLLDFSRRNKRVYNIKAYLITSLFNIPATADINLSNMVRNDLYGNHDDEKG